ncbi:Cytochrome P450 monooxygenase tenB [Fusarium oxysporum f. sp. albedinis]|nr:Cytochrome P450 monooxygenase tenB [Fusarium oxysporum f. sp. albedinis]
MPCIFRILRALNPLSLGTIEPTHSCIKYKIFRHKDISNKDFNQLHNSIKQASKENKSPINPPKKNCNTDILAPGSRKHRGYLL